MDGTNIGVVGLGVGNESCTEVGNELKIITTSRSGGGGCVNTQTGLESNIINLTNIPAAWTISNIYNGVGNSQLEKDESIMNKGLSTGSRDWS